MYHPGSGGRVSSGGKNWIFRPTGHVLESRRTILGEKWYNHGRAGRTGCDAAPGCYDVIIVMVSYTTGACVSMPTLVTCL